MAAWRRLHVKLLTVRGLVTSTRDTHRHRWTVDGSLTLSQSFSTGRPAQNDFFKAGRKKLASTVLRNPNLPPQTVDIMIIGGGVVGWSIAYWLIQRYKIREGARILVVEKDPTYSHASSVMSAGEIRQQFSLPENISLSQDSVDFMKNINEHLGVWNEDPIDLQFNHAGCLFLANEETAPIMEENYTIQRDAGVKVSLLSPKQLKETFPWMNTDGVALASYGLENEGWIDPWALQNAFKRKAMFLGVTQCFGEVTDIRFTKTTVMTDDGDQEYLRRINSVKVQMPNSLEYQPVQCAMVVNAAGAFSAKVMEMLGIGSGPKDTMAEVPLPVEPRKRYYYVVHCPEGPGLDTPFLMDYSGLYLRREGLGGNYIAGVSPEEANEPDTSNLEVDHQFFEDKVRPALACRVPAFETLEVTRAWAGFHDYNTFDQNSIIGVHPLVTNMFLATGFSGHSLQHSPAVGRAVAELILDGRFKTLDLSAFDFKRVLEQTPMLERNIV